MYGKLSTECPCGPSTNACEAGEVIIDGVSYPPSMIWTRGTLSLKYISTYDPNSRRSIYDVLDEAGWFDYTLPEEYRVWTDTIRPVWRAVSPTALQFDPETGKPIRPAIDSTAIPVHQLIRVEINWQVYGWPTAGYWNVVTCLPSRPSYSVLERIKNERGVI